MKLFAGVLRLWRLLKSFGRQIFPKQSTLAARLAVPCRTLRRWLTELRRRGCIQVFQRGPTSGFYVLLQPPIVEDFGLPFGLPFGQASTPHLIINLKRSEEESPRKPPQPERTSVNRPDFEQYFGIFVAAGKALNVGDMGRARAEWKFMDLADRLGAVADALKTCGAASHPSYVPFPINHLRARGWTRIALPRTLPMISQKEQDRNEGVHRLLSERLKKAGGM